jgi:protein-tyrosine phosphatase
MPLAVCFVCLGNICRSPAAEGVMRHMLREAGLEGEIEVDSAGTGDWHVGEPPDRRMLQAARARGYDLSRLRARQLVEADFDRFDLLLAMDHSNLAHLRGFRPDGARAELDLLLQRYRLSMDQVPDPYYGDQQGFEQVLDLLEQGCGRLLAELRERL